jgi:hypothetical protein
MLIGQTSLGGRCSSRELEGVDLVALGVDSPTDALVYTPESLGLVDDIEFEAGSELFIIGYPFAEHPLPTQ